jgi:hypothetical protein
MKRTIIFMITTIIFVVQGQTIRERIDDYNALKAANNADYVQVIEGVGAQMLDTANAQVAAAISIREDAQAQVDADPDMDWETGQQVLGIVNNHMTWPDTVVKSQMLAAFEQIIEIVRAEMNDEYADHGIEKRQQMVAIMSMLVLCIDQNYDPEEPQ